MKSLLIAKPGKIEIVDRPIPDVGPEEILLKIKYVGFCGSDLSTYLGKNPMVSYPRVPGHEVAATIEEIGKEVPKQFLRGQKATVIPYTNCGDCPACKNGRDNACRDNETLGVQRDGAMSSFLAVPWQKVVIEDKLSFKELALIEPLTVGFHAINRAQVNKNDLVMVLGCGMIGMGAIIGALQREATVIAVDIDNQKIELAKKVGAQYAINSKTEDLSTALANNDFISGPNVVIEAVGNPITYKAAIEIVTFTGRVVCIGYAKEDIPLSTKLWVQKELDIRGSRNAAPQDFDAVIEYMRQGEFPYNEFITKIIHPEEAGGAVAIWAENPGPVFKILLNPAD
ncbi:MAG: zinc-binding alcohol dehydrogenase family protein [Bacteroidales bacterium]|nr:zinc-binding alcohol dehydrogenase family protein [Bacteroidales bacterium]